MILMRYGLVALLMFTSCSKKEEPVKEMLIYCGITMIKPMAEIAAHIEKEKNCKITITKGGSGNLLKSLVFNEIGDLFLPGSDRYYKILEKKYPGIITDTVFVGYNKAALMVHKNNPKNISNDLKNLADKNYRVIIGNASSGSIGKEAKKVLEKKGIYQDVLKNVQMLTTDSKALVRVLKDDQADLVINWFAVSTWEENKVFMDALHIKPEYVKVKKLVLGKLKYSKYPQIAKALMDYAVSNQGREIFKKHGFLFEQ